jgi:hypothetical protein
MRPPCARYEGGEDDRRVSNVWHYVAGLLGGGAKADELSELIARLFDYKGELVIATRNPLPANIKQMFRQAWEYVGSEPPEHVYFFDVSSSDWATYWACRRFESNWMP